MNTCFQRWKMDAKELPTLRKSDLASDLWSSLALNNWNSQCCSCNNFHFLGVMHFLSHGIMFVHRLPGIAYKRKNYLTLQCARVNWLASWGFQWVNYVAQVTKWHPVDNYTYSCHIDIIHGTVYTPRSSESNRQVHPCSVFSLSSETMTDAVSSSRPLPIRRLASCCPPGLTSPPCSHISHPCAPFLPRVFRRLGQRFGGIWVVEKCVRNSQIDSPPGKTLFSSYLQFVHQIFKKPHLPPSNY